jgi:hypothetical protein
MKAKTVFEDIRFNFDKPAPYKRYEVKVRPPGFKGPKTPNPKKTGYGGGLTPQEEEIRDRFQLKIQSIQDQIDSLYDERLGLENDLSDLQSSFVNPSEAEEFDAEVIEKYEFGVLDILNSGLSDEDKIEQIDRLNPEKDFGRREYEDLIHNYNYYHPEEPDEEKIEKIERRIQAIDNVIEEKKGMIDRLETKIYNLENY